MEVLDQYTDNKVNLKDLTYNVYLDEYGYLIGVDLVETPNNYVFITGIDTAYSNLSNKTLDASAIFIDGSMDVIEVKADKGDVPEAKNNALVNSWCTYTVDKNGVYTLTEVAGKISDDDDVAQYANAAYTKTIDKKNISLPGGGTGDYNKVYGNDATVYLTASIKEIMTDSNRSDIIIDGVDSVTTGIKNANITPWDAEDARKDAEDDIKDREASGVASGVYTLYKENGYIIAAVVVGEDAAASKNLVYAHTDDVEMESYDKTADEWTWTRKVISDGQEVEIKEVGDALTYLDTMDQYNWYQVKYNADNEVMNVEPASKALILNEDYVTDIDNLEAAINGKEDTVLYMESFSKDQPEMKGSTLFVTTKSTQGFFVAEDVNITLIQIVKNKQETTFETGVDELENIIDDLNEKNGTFNYQISAILEDGAATSVVIYDKTNTYEKPNRPVDSDITVVLNKDGSVDVLYIGEEPDIDDILVAIEDAIEKDGYTVIEKEMESGKYQFIAENDKTGFKSTFTYDSSDKTGVILQPTTREEARKIYSRWEGTAWENFGDLPSLGLDQFIDNNGVVHIEGDVDVVSGSSFGDYQAGIKSWGGAGYDESFDALMAGLAKEGWDVEGVTEVAFVALDENAITMVVNDNGEVRCLKTKDATLTYNDITYDFSGLEF